ncbi:MAG: methylmalonyl-CoA mutase family protein [Ignavibacteriaceae bacterium]|jgi:methylmalonyl-CoA mutase|nr:methylmalonyl-CoA mutase family protein [Ignavibacteriaceae bacterium]
MSQEVKLNEKLNLKKDFPVPSFDEWKQQVEKDLKGESFEKRLITKTYEGINLQPIYTSNDIKDLPQLNNLPGFENYLRGSFASGFNGQDWEISQEYNQSLPEDINDALIYDLKRGLNSINIVLDNPTQLGLDADQSKSGEVGKDGLSISGVRKMLVLFKDIDLSNQPVNISGGFSALPITLLFNAYANETRTSLMNIKGSITSDPYEYLLTKGELPVSLNQIFDEMKLAAGLMIKSNSAIKTIGVSGIVFNNSGANAVQELAFTLASAVEYLNEMISRGLDINDVAKRVKFTFGAGSFYFMEAAKLRAARMLWNKVLEAFGADEENRKMFIHCKASSFNQTYFDPYVNMLRTTTEAFSAIIGGADSIHTNPYDESFNPPDNFSRRIARNTQIVLKEESHLDQVIDPAGGSYFVEKLTDDIANAAWKLFQTIEEKGGMLKSIQSGFVQDEINKVAEARKKDFAKRKSVLVGTNMYANPKEEMVEIKKTDYDAIYKKRVEYIQKYRISGEDKKHRSILNKLQKIADAKSYDMIEDVVDAFIEGASIGEISKSIRASADKGISVQPLKQFRLAEMFEEIKIAAENYRLKTGSKPKIFLAAMGPLKQFKVRADFSRAFFEVGGFEIIYPKGFNTTGDAVNAAIDSKTQAVVICSTDDTYPKLVPPLVKGIKEKSKDMVVILAGYPKDQIEEHKKSGVDDFIYLGADAHQVLGNLFKKILSNAQ